ILVGAACRVQVQCAAGTIRIYLKPACLGVESGGIAVNARAFGDSQNSNGSAGLIGAHRGRKAARRSEEMERGRLKPSVLNVQTPAKTWRGFVFPGGHWPCAQGARITGANKQKAAIVSRRFILLQP